MQSFSLISLSFHSILAYQFGEQWQQRIWQRYLAGDLDQWILLVLDAAITVVAPVTSWLLLLLSGGLIRRQRQLLLLDVAGRVATSSVDGGSCIVADGSMAVGSEAVFILFSHISSESSGSSGYGSGTSQVTWINGSCWCLMLLSLS